MSSPIPPDPLASAKYFVFVTQIHFCAMYAVVAWDWLTSVPREWQLIWKSRWTPVKVSYIFCRYWVLCVGWVLLYCYVGNHSLQKCQILYKLPVALAMWNQLASEVILLIRTYAFFNRNLYILLSLSAALLGVAAYQLYVATDRMLLLPFLNNPDYGPCFPMSRPHTADILGFFIAPLCYDTVVTALIIGKAFMIKRRSGSQSSQLVQTFIKEGVFYYIFISIANLINGIFYLQPNASMSAICIPLSVYLSPVLACRLILDLRARGTEVMHAMSGQQEIHSPTTPTSSAPRFYQPSGSLAPGYGRNNKSLVNRNNSRAVTTTITMDGVEMADFNEDELKPDVDYHLEEDRGIGGIKVDVETTNM